MGRPKNPANTLHKICPTCGRGFTCERRKEKTYCSKKCSCNSPEVKQKNREGVQATFEEKYGGHPMAVNEETKDRFKKKINELYGTDYFTQAEEFGAKVKATKLERYGDANYNNVEQIKSTCMSKYGVDNYRKTDEYAKKYKETCLKKYGVPHVSMTGDFKKQIKGSTFKHSHKLAMFKKFYTSEKFKNFTPLFNIDEYDGITVQFNRPYKFKCNRCNTEHDYDLTHQHLRCPVCDSSISTFQSEVTDYVKFLLPNEPVITNNRAVLSPLELDIYVPDRNIAIETNGLYWHAEVSGAKDKNYHLNKTKLCLTKGIRLLHIYENEWNRQQEIVKSILENILLKPSIANPTYVVKEIAAEVKSEFLVENHLEGNDASTVRLGLFVDDKLVSVMTFVTSKFDKSAEWEIVRNCSKVASPFDGNKLLFEYFVKNYNPQSVSVYVDRRYFSGQSYMEIGFQVVKTLPPSYHYIIDSYDTLENKNNWQKCKLARKLLSFDPTLSEWENMKMNGFDRIWDCGHTKWVFKNHTTLKS